MGLTDGSEDSGDQDMLHEGKDPEDDEKERVCIESVRVRR